MRLFLRVSWVLSVTALRFWSCWTVVSPYKIHTAWVVCSIRCTGFFLWSEAPCMFLLLRILA